MYFSHERSSPIQISDRERDWRETNEETDMFEMEQFAHSQRIFQENVQKERLKEEMYFQNIRNSLSVNDSQNGIYHDNSHKVDDTSAYGDNVENNYDGHTHAEPSPNEFGETTSKSYMDIYHEEKQQKERDDMEKHLRIVREKIRLRRLEHESNTLKIMHEHNDKSSNEYVNLSVLNDAVEQQQNIVSQYEHEQEQQKQEENSYASLEQLLPKREVNAREELFNRRPEKWKDANNAGGQPQNNGTSRSHRVRRRQMATNADFGGGLGDCMIQREQDTISHPANSNTVHNTHQARQRRGRPMATISDFGGSLGDVMSNRRRKRSGTDRGNSQADQHQGGNEMTRTTLQRRRERESMQNWGGGSLSDVLVQPTRAAVTTTNPSTSSVQNIPENNVARQQGNGSGNDIWAGQSLGDILPQRRRNQRTRNNSQSNIVNNSQHERSQAPSRVNNMAETASIWQGQSLGDIMPPTSSDRGGNSTRSRGGNSTATRGNGVMNSQQRDSRATRSTFVGNTGDYMADNAMTYERLLALDDAVPNRRLQMAKKNKLSSEDLYKKLRTGFYRKKPNQKEADECAICLDGFKHHAPIKVFPCSHIFHAECAKELLKYDTRCALCRYDVAAGGHT